MENLETGLALPELPGCGAIMKLGNSVSALACLPWLRSARILYWGDLDTHGLAILNRARQALGDVTSVMMDEGTLLSHRPLWVEETTPHAQDSWHRLTPIEHALFDKLCGNEWGVRVRLEQERIPWADAMTNLMAAL